jgi:hypothetical protein
MSEENKEKGQEIPKQEASLSEQDLKEVSGGASFNFSKIQIDYKPQKPDGSLDA